MQVADDPRSRRLPHRGDYHEDRTARSSVWLRWPADSNLFGPSTRSFGIYYDDSVGDAARGAAGRCVHHACRPAGHPAGELELREIRGGRYAVTLHVGPYAELERAYKWLYGTWLAQSGEEPADAPCIEEYLNDARTRSADRAQD